MSCFHSSAMTRSQTIFFPYCLIYGGTQQTFVKLINLGTRSSSFVSEGKASKLPINSLKWMDTS